MQNIKNRIIETLADPHHDYINWYNILDATTDFPLWQTHAALGQLLRTEQVIITLEQCYTLPAKENNNEK